MAANPKEIANRGIIPLLALSGGAANIIEEQVSCAADKVRPAMANLLFHQLFLALWLVVSKVRLKRGSTEPFLLRLLKKYSFLPSIRELNLWISMLLCALKKFGHVPSADITFYRRDPGPLAKVTRKQINQIAAEYGTLRAMQKEFIAKPERSPEQLILELLVMLRRRLEEAPDAISPTVRAEVQSIQTMVRLARRSKKKPAIAKLIHHQIARKPHTAGGKNPNKK